ncbi:MAG TPA: hypothetical protein PLM73_05935 [Petrotogaceae bacterium]|nr:hypothetical protein [Petrotogaceae bacterium]HQF33232.1 hypothetical protein [Petrotogaceae bacterium]HQH33836.1 hypothetical protein [Petrotogaceae bacterium]HQI79431.1 hypothetical protein [Petrotogaceae bacterium]
MEFSLDQIIQIMLAKLENVEMSLEDLKFRTNIALRVLRKSGALTDEELKASVKDEFTAMVEIEGKKVEVPQEKVDEVAKSIIQWVDNDLDAMKKKVEEYQKQVEDMMAKEKGSADISVAPPDLLNRLDAAKKTQNRQGKGGIILS